jgi:hypothetical protein
MQTPTVSPDEADFAAALGATLLYTEDLNHGQVYGRGRAWNPFRDTVRPPLDLQ